MQIEHIHNEKLLDPSKNISFLHSCFSLCLLSRLKQFQPKYLVPLWVHLCLLLLDFIISPPLLSSPLKALHANGLFGGGGVPVFISRPLATASCFGSVSHLSFPLLTFRSKVFCTGIVCYFVQTTMKMQPNVTSDHF